MITNSVDERELITELSKDIVSQVAPEELDLFDELIQEYFDDPTPPDLTTDNSDDPLGFGLGEVMVAATPAIAAAISAGITFLLTVAWQADAGSSVTLIKQKIQQRFQRKQQADLDLSKEQLTQLKRIVHSTVLRFGTEQTVAGQISDAVIVTLVLSPAADGPIQRPVSVLFLAANPMGTELLRLDKEISAIEEALYKAKFRERFVLEQNWAVRVTELQALLLRYRPDIVHFSGHGSPAGELLFEGRDGAPQPATASALHQLFHTLRDNVRCVVLNACYSTQQATAIAEVIDCVVGMSSGVSDAAAIEFSTAFYRALGYGRNVETAFALGVGQLKLIGQTEQDVPQLLSLRNLASQLTFVQDAR